MIQSVTTDEEWLSHLQGTPAWQPKARKVAVLAPHPDDETLGAGALIATLRERDVPVAVIAATDGENAYDTLPEERLALGRLREAEQAAALEKLGVVKDCIHRLRLPDSGLHTCEAELTRRLAELVGEGTLLVAPWEGDFHPDHVACARAATSVANDKALPLLSYFFWTWHRGTPDLLGDMKTVRFEPEQAALQAKAAALRCHQSQLHRESGDPILPEDLLGPARWPFEVFLPA